MQKLLHWKVTQQYHNLNKEWAVIGFIGQFIVDDDGTCVPGRRCVVTDGGIATLSPTNKVGYRVMERIDNTHIRIIASFL